MATYTEKAFKSALNVRKNIDGWFWDKYSLNPYNGCQFGCIYCDSRSKKYYLPDDFENDIVVKKGIGRMLDDRISRARALLPDVVALGGTTDPYQPAEAIYRNTRQCLEVLKHHGWPAHVCTKSTLVLDDLGLLESVAKRSWCAVSVTVTTSDPITASLLEPGTPSPQERFSVIRTIKEKCPHVLAGLLLMPTVPDLTDSRESMQSVLAGAKDAGADYVVFGGGMTLRDQQAKHFLNHLAARQPETIGLYEKLYRFNYKPDEYQGDYTPEESYTVGLVRLFRDICTAHGLPQRIKRYIPDDHRRYNYIAAEQLLNTAYERQSAGRPWKHLYWAGQTVQGLKEPITAIAARNQLGNMGMIDAEAMAIIKEGLSDAAHTGAGTPVQGSFDFQSIPSRNP